LSTDKVSEALKNFGLTKKEADTYTFLAIHGAQRSGEIAKKTKMHRGEVYRILKNLQAKGLVQSTLEAPTRFIAVPFENLIESFIESKRNEAASIENAKQDLIKDWTAISKNDSELQTKKFAVLEGRQKIYRKFLEMVNKTERQLSTITSAQALIRIDQFGIIEAALIHPLKSRVQFKLITEVTKENLATVKHILNQADSAGINLHGRTLESGSNPIPQMVIRDGEEAVFFIKAQADLPQSEQDQSCLWTDSKSLVHAFQKLFDEAWGNSSSDLRDRARQIAYDGPRDFRFSGTC